MGMGEPLFNYDNLIAAIHILRDTSLAQLNISKMYCAHIYYRSQLFLRESPLFSHLFQATAKCYLIKAHLVSSISKN